MLSIKLQCEKDVGMGHCLYDDLGFMLSSLPCLYTFWHAIPTSFYIFDAFYFLFLYFIDVNLSDS